MAVVKGMLMQSKGKKGVVMTPAGEFINVILPHEHVEPGEEIEALRLVQRKPFKYLTAVAAVLLMVLLIPGYLHFYPTKAMAYVALDINPSIELAVNKDLKILDVQGLNNDGEKIASEIDIAGMQLYQGVPLLVKQAITDGYLECGRENVVLSTVTVIDNKEKIGIKETDLRQVIYKPIQQQQMAARVVVEQSNTTERDQAKKIGLSTGKYLIYKEARQQGINLSVDEIRNQGLYQLEQQLSPGQEKKLQQSSKKLKENVQINKAAEQVDQVKNQNQIIERKEKLPRGLEKKLIQDNPGQLPLGIEKQLEYQQQRQSLPEKLRAENQHNTKKQKNNN